MTSTVGRSANPTERTYLSIREVLELLIGDFPEVTISKIRFLEARGLIHPERTPSGYRKFYREDVDRLRWILRQQRENYLPLNVIKVRLDGGLAVGDLGADAPSLFDDAPYEPPPPGLSADESFVTPSEKAPAILRGHPAEGVLAPRHLGIHRDTPLGPTETPVVEVAVSAPALTSLRTPEHLAPQVTPQVTEMAPVAPEASAATAISTGTAAAPVLETPVPKPPPASRTRSAAPRRGRTDHPGEYSMSELAIAIGADPAFVAEIANYGLISGKDVGGERCFDESARLLAQVAHDFSFYGIEPRHLKSLQHAAIREAEVFSQVVVPLLRQRNPEAREKAQADLAALVSLGAAFKSSLIQAELRNLTGG